MNFELFVASLLFAAGCSLIAYLAAAARLGRRGGSPKFDVTAVETRLADFITEMNHVANSHAHAIEDRRAELKRMIEMANERLRRFNGLLSDLEIIEKRLRGTMREQEDTQVLDDPLVHQVRVTTPTVGVTRGAIKVAAGPDRQGRRQAIESLAAAGLTAVAIASELRLTRNEVELVLRGRTRGADRRNGPDDFSDDL